MHFNTKNYLKSNSNHTVKLVLSCLEWPATIITNEMTKHHRKKTNIFINNVYDTTNFLEKYYH